MPQYKDCKIESMGPFGIGATCSISVKKEDELIGFLTVGYDNSDYDDFGKFNYIDYNAPKKQTYPDGSIGDMNGFNYQTHKLPTEIDEAIKVVFKMEH